MVRSSDGREEMQLSVVEDEVGFWTAIVARSLR
jgi:hypothetical protein